MSDFEHLVSKSRQAANGGFGVLSVGEKVAAALVLNRHDWLGELGYTIPEALARVGPEWAAMIPAAAKLLKEADVVVQEAAKGARDEAALLAVAGGVDGEDIVDVNATLVSSGQAPGYRDAHFTFDVQRLRGDRTHRLCIRVTAQDGESMARHLVDIHRLAWERGEPLDIQPGEKRSRWIDQQIQMQTVR